MLTVISPAKRLDFETSPMTAKCSTPGFPEQTRQLVEVMRTRSAKDLSKLMGISPGLAELNVERFKNFKTRARGEKQAVLAFKGDVYIGINVESYGERDFTFAQKNLRILSGLYGLLKPLDLIQPYRLEMGTKLKTKHGGRLYDFWGSRIGDSLAAELENHRNKTLINLASKEYFQAAAAAKLPGRLITPVFKDEKNGTYKVLSFFAKKARGAMASFIVKNRINKPGDIRQFNEDGYIYNEDLSTEYTWTFTRKASR